MVKTEIICDFCKKPIKGNSERRYIEVYKALDKYKQEHTKEVYDMCKDCYNKILLNSKKESH